MSQPSQPAHPTFINLPQAPSNPDTPSEMPGTPTSTTTSLSTLSTTAIKDGYRGHANQSGGRGHNHNVSTNSIEAERADRISRLAGLSNVSTLRPPPFGPQSAAAQSGASPHMTPSSTGGMPPNVAFAQVPGGSLTPAYFDAHGQPVAQTKISTVGTASATESVGGRTMTDTGEDGHTMAGEYGDEDMLSMDTNYRETEVGSESGYAGGGDIDPMDEDLASRSVGGFEDRMSDDGSASLVGFGEGAGSTVSGPIYHRRPLPGGVGSNASAMSGMWGLERSISGLSEGAMLAHRRDTVRAIPPVDREGATGGDTPVSIQAMNERREARMVDGIATGGGALSQPSPTAPIGLPTSAAADDNVFVDTTTTGPVPVPVSVSAGGGVQPQTSAIRETQQPQSLQHQLQHLHQQGGVGSTSREAVERLIRERLDDGESAVERGDPALSSAKGGESLGRFYFEDRK